jgi:C1A family cysteine protease
MGVRQWPCSAVAVNNGRNVLMKKSRRSLVAGVAVFLMAAAFSAPAFSQTSVLDQIAQIQALINQHGGKWVAGVTSLSGLSQEEWQSRVGLSFTVLKAAPLPDLSDKAIPASLDWRNANGNFVTGIRDQKKCGSCWAFALTGALESYVIRTRNTPGTDLDLSEQVMLSCSGVGSCNGGTLDGSYLQSTGLPPETFYPYTAANGTCSSAGAGWQKAAYKIDGWGSVSHNLSSIKSALATYGPLPIAMMVYEDFMNYKSGVYSYTTGKKLGGHGVVVVGYNDAGQYFIVKNSWGPGWGDNGFFKIAYSEVNSVTSFGLSTVAYKPNGSKEAGAAVTAGFNSDATWGRVAPMFEALEKWSN